MNLKNAVALVTGGSQRHRARAIAQTLAESGARVAITGRGTSGRLDERSSASDGCICRASGLWPKEADVEAKPIARFRQVRRAGHSGETMRA